MARGYRSAIPPVAELACTKVNRVMLIKLCTETIKPVFEGDKIGLLWNAWVYHVNPLSRITGWERAFFSGGGGARVSVQHF